MKSRSSKMQRGEVMVIIGWWGGLRDETRVKEEVGMKY